MDDRRYFITSEPKIMSEASSVIDLSEFDAPQERPVKFRDREFLLRVADGAAVVEYDNMRTRALTLNEDGKPEKLGDISNAGPVLLSRCLFYNDGPQKGEAVPSRVILGWPAQVQTRLITICKEMSDIDQPNTESLEKQIERLQEKLQKEQKKEAERKKL